jgi:aminoglycoside phosphotransferase family enzyme
VTETTRLPAEPDLPARLRFLQTPAAHAGYAGADAVAVAVDTIETHMSWVFLAGAHVAKMKKAVRYPFLDFSTLRARELDCREELRLNTRLAPGVYRGLLALLWQPGGGLALVPEDRLPAGARVLDWLVLMRRLPAARMLDRLVAEDGVAATDIDALVGVLTAFYRRATACTDADPVERFQREQAASREVLLRPQFRLHGAATALDGLDAALLRHRALLRSRAAAGRIVDGHGDLRPEHVCLLQPPVVIDALEFNAALRQVDPFDELSYLGLECEMSGAAWIGPRLVQGCAAALGDAPPAALLTLYTAARALLRARLAMAHLLDPQPRRPAHWPVQAQRYIERALQALAALDGRAGVNAATIRGTP